GGGSGGGVGGGSGGGLGGGIGGGSGGGLGGGSGGGGSCVPKTCGELGKDCGSVSNGCGATITCGSCTSPLTCGGGGVSNVCGSPAGRVVISQIYGAGGNAGATWTHDFVELFNPSSVTVNLSGWSLQYGSATGTTWQVTPLSGVLTPGRYLLVQQASGGGGTTPLPAPDVVGSVGLAASSGKIALVRSTTALPVACPMGGDVVDIVGYGSATCFEGSAPAPAPGTTLSINRIGGGCSNLHDNAGDFMQASPSPRNTSSTPQSCSGAP
ncbi:MAG: lamin tail domain-containing protein, partial [Myxococcota bacterium]